MNMFNIVSKHVATQTQFPNTENSGGGGFNSILCCLFCFLLNICSMILSATLISAFYFKETKLRTKFWIMQHFFFILINISLINTMYIYHQTFSVDASRVPRVWQQRSKSQRQALNLIFFSYFQSFKRTYLWIWWEIFKFNTLRINKYLHFIKNSEKAYGTISGVSLRFK